MNVRWDSHTVTQNEPPRSIWGQWSLRGGWALRQRAKEVCKQKGQQDIIRMGKSQTCTHPRLRLTPAFQTPLYQNQQRQEQPNALLDRIGGADPCIKGRAPHGTVLFWIILHALCPSECTCPVLHLAQAFA
mmetsp:Transcript_7710/g.11649  ORF Transcript_7710/g.11649 Transcript_7710/m.11649 type:complete len:131 (-) Transcript_7710:283-675(-)